MNLRSNYMDRILAAVPPQGHVTPYEWLERTNGLCANDLSVKRVTLAEFCECASVLLAAGFVSREARIGDADGKSIVVLYHRTNAT